MTPDILHNLLNPPILFFFLGMLAVFFKSDLEIPQPLPRFFSFYLLMAIGLKGGFELSHSGFSSSAITSLGAAVLMASVVPLLAFFFMKRYTDNFNAAGIAATYGSISAVTFITAIDFLTSHDIVFGGHMVAAMALMESPAIIVGIALTKIYQPSEEKTDWKEVGRDAFLNASVFLIVGSLVIGLLSGHEAQPKFKPFTDDIFKGFLCFFFLYLAIASARRIGVMLRKGKVFISFAIIFPLLVAFLGMALGYVLGLEKGDLFLLTILSGSASYIAVPAAFRVAVPDADPGLYIPMALGITFPFNITIGIPLYYSIINYLFG